MSEPAVDHRRATSERNTAAILDATERLIARRTTLSMAAIATEAGVSRPTLYAHFASLSEVVEATVERAVNASMQAIEAAEPSSGAADEALARVLAAAWAQLARHDALAAAAAEHVPSDRLERKHAPLMEVVHGLVTRGQAEAVFRTDMAVDWLVTVFYALIHAAAEHARTHRVARADVGEMLERSIRDVLIAR